VAAAGEVKVSFKQDKQGGKLGRIVSSRISPRISSINSYRNNTRNVHLFV
jgi:hypothetical protein